MDRKALIKEAYITPIRSVLAIDDEFTSLDSFLAEQGKGISEIQKTMLAHFRENKWLVDMHDGSGDETGLISHLHQCDLLVVDYHLDQSDDTDASKSLNIIKQLNQNEHFNLVVVYTSADSKSVQNTLIETLSSPTHTFNDHNNDYSEIIELISEWEESSGENVIDELVNKLNDGDFSKLYKQPEILDTDLQVIFSPLEGYLIENNFENYQAIELLKFIFTKKMSLLVEQGLYQGTSKIWHSNDENYYSVKTSQMFVTVISKDTKPENIPTTLLSALENWYPTTNRLLLAKIRAELEANGVLFEEQILDCQFTNSGWLQQFVDQHIDGTSLTISRLFEVMSTTVNLHVQQFAQHLKNNISEVGFNQSITHESNFDPTSAENKININKFLNAYICSKPVSGTHFETGHIIKWKNSQSHEYLLCLTPICDLVPDRKGKGWQKKLSPVLPIKVIKLHKLDKSERNQLKDIEKKGYVAFIEDSNVELLAVTSNGSLSMAMEVEQVFVSNRGLLRSSNSKVYSEVHRVIYEGPSTSIRGLHNITQECEIVGQLRYEYALNLLNQLGVDLTRVGLDFIKLSS